MSMVFCHGCGKEIHETAPTCPGCGAPQHLRAASAVAAETPEQLWERRFALIDKAGGAGLPKVWSLPAKEIWGIKFNLLAFLFGPFYYANKGMWKRGVTFTVISFLAAGFLAWILESMGGDGTALIMMVPGFLSGQANVSYYKATRLGQNGWW